MNRFPFARMVFPLHRTRIIPGRVDAAGTLAHADWKLSLIDFPQGNSIFDPAGVSKEEVANSPELKEVFSVFPEKERASMVSSFLGDSFLPTALVVVDLNFPQLSEAADMLESLEQMETIDEAMQEVEEALFLACRIRYSGDFWWDKAIIYTDWAGDYCYTKEPSTAVTSFGEDSIIPSDQGELQRTMERLLQIFHPSDSHYRKVMSIALSFFGSSYQHFFWTHRFMDLAISIEAAFKGEDETLKNAIPRFSTLISHSQDEHATIQRQMSGEKALRELDTFFNVRHKIMHGDISLHDDLPMRTIEICRPLIKRAFTVLLDRFDHFDPAANFYEALQNWCIEKRFSLP